MSAEYALEVSKHVVARICLALGFKKISASCLRSLSEILLRYLKNLVCNFLDRFELSSKASISCFDLICVLEKQKLNIFREIRDYVSTSKGATSKWYNPFHYKVPEFPLYSPLPNTISDSNRPAYLPSHFPSFPPIHTYKSQLVKKKNKSSDSTEGSVNKKPRSNWESNSTQSHAASLEFKQCLADIEDATDRKNKQNK